LTAPIAVTVEGFISGIAIDAVCQNVFVANQEAGRVDVYALTTGARVRTVWTGEKPRGLDFNPDGSALYISSESERKITVVNPDSGTVIDQIPSPSATLFPAAVAIGADGTLLFVATTADYFGGQVYTWEPVKREATAITAFSRVDAMTSLSANVTRSVIAVGGVLQGRPGVGRYIVSSRAADTIALDQSGQFTETPGVAFSATGAAGVAVSAPVTFTLSGSSRTVLELISGLDAEISADGALAFFTFNADKMRVVGLADPSLTGFIPLGATAAGTTGKIALSADSTLAVVQTAKGFSIVPTALRARDALTFLANSSAADAPQSLLRFYNNSDPGTVTVTLADAATGTVLTTWKSPVIASHAAPQYAISTIENAASKPFAKPPRYLVTVTSEFPGTFSQAAWMPGKAITNITSCEADPTVDGILSHVHSSLIDGQYRSYVSIHNRSPAPAEAQFTIYTAAGGIRDGTHSVEVPGGGVVTLSMSEIETLARLMPAGRTQVFHYSLQASTPTELRFQHLVHNAGDNVLVDMTPACALPYTRLR
jgi:hypothetical protein